MERLTPKVPLNSNQYYQQQHKKKFIFLHHTAGWNMESAIATWNAKLDHIATPFIIERDGKVYQTFDPKKWSYALGLKGGTNIEKASIGIELISLGALKQEGGNFFFYSSPTAKRKEIPPSEVVSLPRPWKGHNYFQKYTPEQIASLEELLLELMQEFGIRVQSNISQFWEYQDKWASSLNPGIWSHTSVRTDKLDIFPQQDLIEMIYELPRE